jgi:hypothetical protein
VATVWFGFVLEMISNLKAFSSFQGVPLVVLRRLSIVAFYFFKVFKIVSSLPL